MTDFTITTEWLQAYARNSNLTRHQAESLGEPYPLTSGWMQRLEGKVISHGQRLQYERQLRSSQVRDTGGGSLDLF